MTDPAILALFVDFDWSQFALRTVIGAAFVVLGLMCVVATVLGLPGLWGLLLLAGGIELSDLALRDDGTHTFSPWTLATAIGLAVLAEVIEFAAGAAGAKKAGASSRGVVGAMVGGIVGAIAGAPFGLLIGSIAGGVLGSAIGAIVMELTLPHQTLRSALRPAQGAAVGRLQGLLAKLAITVALWLGLSIASFVE